MKKIIKSSSCEGSSQILMWTRMNHENIVQMIDWFEDSETIHIVMELAKGGDLFDRIVSKMSEEAVACAFGQILLAAKHFHSNNVIHCDIKPENILCMGSNNDLVKVADFGLAQIADESTTLKHYGTLAYAAPEVVDGLVFDSMADMWSLGVLLYAMIAGFAPFGQAEKPDQIRAKIKQCRPNFKYQVFNSVSPEAIDLIQKLLVLSPNQRLTAAEALQHPWVANCAKRDQREQRER